MNSLCLKIPRPFYHFSWALSQRMQRIRNEVKKTPTLWTLSSQSMIAYPQHTNPQVLGLKLTDEVHLDVCKSDGTMQHLDFPLSLPHFQGYSDYLLPLAIKVKRVEATSKLRKF